MGTLNIMNINATRLMTLHFHRIITLSFVLDTVADPGSVKRGGRESKFLDSAPENRPK